MEAALSKWSSKPEKEPKSIDSRLVLDFNTDQTNFLIVRHTSVSMIPFLRHYFVQVGYNVWHPGKLDKTIFFEKMTSKEETAIIHEILEMCDFCTYNYFKTRFLDNDKFFLLTRNCEIILGYYEETIFMYIIISLLTFMIINGFTVVPTIILLGILLFFLLIPRQKTPNFYSCSHIRLNSKAYHVKEDFREFPIFKK